MKQSHKRSDQVKQVQAVSPFLFLKIQVYLISKKVVITYDTAKKGFDQLE